MIVAHAEKSQNKAHKMSVALDASACVHCRWPEGQIAG